MYRQMVIICFGLMQKKKKKKRDLQAAYYYLRFAGVPIEW